MSRYVRVLAFRDFRHLFLGQVASVIGDQVVIVALALFVTQLTGSPSDLGLVFGLQALALVLLLLFGGVWADRLPRQRIMIATDLIRATLHMTLAVLIFTGAVRIWEVIAIEAAFGAAEAFFRPAYSGKIPQTVPEELIQDANGLTQAVDNASLLIGPALATALIVIAGAGAAFGLDAATFLLSALLLAHVKPRARGRAQPAARALHELRAGWRELRERTWVWVTIAVFSGTLFCALAPWIVLGPTVARELYGRTSIFGLLTTLVGAGAIAGALTAVHWRPRRPLRAGLPMLLAWPLYTCALALAAPLWITAPIAVTMGIGWALMRVWWETALARHVPPHALSRVSAYDWMGSLVLLPLGYLAAGPLASALGARTVLAVGGAIGLVLIAAALLSADTRDLSDKPHDADVATASIAARGPSCANARGIEPFDLIDRQTDLL